MGEEGKFYSRNMTSVIWNMDDYPIPAAGVEDGLGFIRTNIEEVGHRMGFHGPMEIEVYCKRIKGDVQEELSGKAKIYYSPSWTTPYRLAGVNKPAPLDMTYFLVHYSVAVCGPHGPEVDFVVIAKPQRELNRVVKCLHSRGNAILVIDPTAITGSFFSVESLLGCACLLRPTPRPDPFSCLPYDFTLAEYQAVEEYIKRQLNVKEDTSKIVDFLDPIRPVKENRIGVFWDADAFPLPPSYCPDKIYALIESALVGRGFIGKLSIWVYHDDDSSYVLRKKKWPSRIYFLPGGDKAYRRVRMANDIQFWLKDDTENVSFQEISILFSDQFKDDAEYSHMLQNLVACGCGRILSVSPTQSNNRPKQPESLEWPGLLTDIGGEWVSDAFA